MRVKVLQTLDYPSKGGFQTIAAGINYLMSRSLQKLRPEVLGRNLANAVSAFDSISNANLDDLLQRIGDAKLVLLGEASHGTSEFYSMRARITQELISKRHFNFVAVEADWPDADMVDRYVRHHSKQAFEHQAFSRFPEWMWRNLEVQNFVEWLRNYNQHISSESRVGFHGLDLYGLSSSMNAVIHYLSQVDTVAAAQAREHYSCLQPWARDPAAYGAAVISGKYKDCEEDTIRALQSILEKRLEYIEREDGGRFFSALQNARAIRSAERYYRAMYYGRAESWNIRDEHMFNTLQALLKHYGKDAKAIVWAHNSHLGDASATEKEFRNEINIGELCRKTYGDKAYLIGFGTDHGQVAAASDWGGPMEIKEVRPALHESYEYVFHLSGVPSFFLPLRMKPEAGPNIHMLRDELMSPRLERAIGVIYRPDTERVSHYFYAVLPQQFDEYIWFDRTSAVNPLDTTRTQDAPDTYPFGV